MEACRFSSLNLCLNLLSQAPRAFLSVTTPPQRMHERRLKSPGAGICIAYIYHHVVISGIVMSFLDKSKVHYQRLKDRIIRTLTSSVH